jgi:hypothetical protein
MGFGKFNVIENGEVIARRITKAEATAMVESAPAPATQSPPILSAPNVGWRLISRRRFSAGGNVYDRGAAVPVEALGKNYQQLLDNGVIGWTPPSKVNAAVVVRAAPAPPPPRTGSLIVVFVDDPNPIIAFKKTVAATAERNSLDHELARNLIFGTDKGSRLFQLATRVASERENKMHGRRVAVAL